MSEELIIDELTFTINHSVQRKSLAITIERDGTLSVSVPASCPTETIENYVKQKLLWVYTKLSERESYAQPVREREYVNGEGFYYLGRSYRLLITVTETSKTVPLKYWNGRFYLAPNALLEAPHYFARWYSDHALVWIQKRAPDFINRIGIKPQAIQIRDLKYRWASCSASGTLNFHWRAILLPPLIIDYLIVHEMMHLREPEHSDTFWQRVERILPDYADRKRWLAEEGGKYYL